MSTPPRECQVISLEDYVGRLRAIQNYKNNLDPDKGESPGTLAALTISLIEGEKQITTNLQAILINNVVHINNEQAAALKASGFSQYECPGCPALEAAVRGIHTAPLSLTFTREDKKPIYYPLTKSAAAGVILAFFNGNLDPLGRIKQMYGANDIEDAKLGRIITTYYLSCLKYITDVNLSNAFSENDGMIPMIDHLSLVSDSARAKFIDLTRETRSIPATMIAFQAVFGAYAMCRAVENKRDFKEWMTKRFSAFTSSLHQTAEANINLQYKDGGNLINQVVTGRPMIRKSVVSVIGLDLEDPRAIAVKLHVKMLVALTNMTVYSLIQKVIRSGGAVICLKPLPDQLVSYIEERKELLGKLRNLDRSEDELVYIHLIIPDIQCFTASRYADLIVTARALESLTHKSKSTLEQYKAKIDNATLNESTVLEFLRSQKLAGNLLADPVQKEKLREILGDSTDALFKEAERVLKLMNTQY